MNIEIFFRNPFVIDDFSEKIPQKVRQYFKEAVLCYGHETPNAATIMCKKLILEICNNNANGSTLLQKIGSLKVDKKIINFLRKTPDIDDVSINLKPWPKMFVKKYIELLASAIEEIYL